jgi:hypothetical protein
MIDKRRRKSLSLFRSQKHDQYRPETPTNLSSSLTDENIPREDDPSSPRIRPRTLQKQNRASVFGSLRSLHSLDEDEKAALTRTDSKASSGTDDQDMNKRGLFGSAVIQHGEVQSAVGNVFRKKSQYAVLTESHLIRFRTSAKAAEMFPSIPASMTRTSSRMSVASYSELQMSTYSDISSGIELDQVVAVYKLDDGRPFFTIEVACLDERSKQSSIMQLHIIEPREAELWTTNVRAVALKARSKHEKGLQRSTLEDAARILEKDHDYDPDHFRVFKVVQRAGPKGGGRSSAEDLTKLTSTVRYLAVGLHKVHLIPCGKGMRRSSTTSLSEWDSVQTFGITTLTSIKAQAEEDAFQLTFKTPLRQPHTLSLASSDVTAIILSIKYVADFVRPEWLRQPFLFDVPPSIEDQMRAPPASYDDYGCFDRTLMAYCAGYQVDSSRICYTVDHNCEDAAQFLLLAPAGEPYNVLELLAVLKALRYNESFVSISFANVNLCSLRYLYDVYATDFDSVCGRSGIPVNLPGHHDLPVLCQEIRALALKSRKLRRFDFTSAFPLLSQGEDECDSCCVPEALVPLCKKGLTNVDWIILNGVKLADSDLNFLVDAASERTCHLRALEVGECGLSIHDADVLLSTLALQDNTMEVINISGVQGRFSAEMFQRQIGAFRYIRRLNLSRVHKTSGPEPLIPPEILMIWRLEALYLAQTVLNQQTVDSIAAYLACPRSETLRELDLNQCQLTGSDLAVFFRSMAQSHGTARDMHINASENRLKQGMSSLFKSIATNQGPSSLTMRMIDFEKERQFRELIEALTVNTTVRSLDISRASLPYDASTQTCEALKTMFATNQTLEELDISGEHAHLDATRFGIGLNIALRGLEHNRSLKLLRIEHQSLGMQGANTLAEVIEKNDTLLEIHCEHNELNLQSFTVLVNALENNKTLQYLPTMDADRAKSMEKVRREIETVERSESPKTPHRSAMSIKRMTLGSALAVRRDSHKRVPSTSSSTSFTEQDISIAVNALDDKWNYQISRLQHYLYRNYCLAHGLHWHEETPRMSLEKRPDTATSLQKVLDKVMLSHRTPSKERGAIFDTWEDKGIERESETARAILELRKD